jgi:hypothetical protein
MKTWISVVLLVFVQGLADAGWQDVARDCEEQGVPFLWVVTFRDVISINEYCKCQSTLAASSVIDGSFIIMADSPYFWQKIVEDDNVITSEVRHYNPDYSVYGKGMYISISYDGPIRVTCGSSDYRYYYFNGSCDYSAGTLSIANNNTAVAHHCNTEGCFAKYDIPRTVNGSIGVYGSVDCVPFMSVDLPCDFDPNTITVDKLLGTRTFKKFSQVFSGISDVNCLSRFIEGWLESPEDFDCNE